MSKLTPLTYYPIYDFENKITKRRKTKPSLNIITNINNRYIESNFYRIISIRKKQDYNEYISNIWGVGHFHPSQDKNVYAKSWILGKRPLPKLLKC